MEKQSEQGFMVHTFRFPSLSNARGIMPWDPNQLDIWAAEFGRDQQALHAVRFLLQKWNPSFAWECGKFEPKIALDIWDRTHRRAFLELATQELNYSA